MRWVTYRHGGVESWGRISADGEGIASGSGHYASLRDAIADAALTDLAGELGDGADVALAEIELLPPIPKPDKILCIGLNYAEHQAETGRGGEGVPTVFTRFAASQMGHGAPLIKPFESDALDYEGEIAIVIGDAGRRIKRADALSHIAGFSCYNDGSVRDFQRQTSQFTPGKNFVGTGGFGPWLMTPDEVGDLDSMRITTRLNGEVMQDATSDLLIHGFAEIIEYCSVFTELVPGDVIVTGTPGGVGAARTPPVFMRPGDVCEVEIQPIGTLRNPVIEG
ncbi:MAG: fumarylacetoacetate hydrolase family protein [Pseudomonadaceae bacterium]|nr:fumarylacetoacetate hydrolase family protein [Pseudomonadaceae bacterium]